MMKKNLSGIPLILACFCFSSVSGQVFKITSEHLMNGTDISSNGIVALKSDLSGTNFIWSESRGLELINTVTNGGILSGKTTISKDGSKMAITATNPATNMNEMALYDVNTKTITYLGGIGASMSSEMSSAWGISGDGNTIVGFGYATDGWGHGISWNPTDGMKDLGTMFTGKYSSARAISSDATVTAGYQDGPNGRQGTMWKNGTQILMTDNNGNMLSYPEAISADGKYMVGSSGTYAYRWSEATGVETISHPNAGASLRGNATAISDDGSIVIGYYRDPNSNIYSGEGFIWTPSTGRIELNQYVQSLGMDTQGMVFSLPLGISPDGKMITGGGRTNDSNAYAGFVIKLPELPLSTKETSEKSIRYYPNPVTNKLNLSTKKHINSVSIYNATGQIISQQQPVNGQVDTQKLSKGTYIVKAALEGDITESFKIIKQ